MPDLTEHEIEALAESVNYAIDDQSSYLFGVGGLNDYSDEEWTEVCESKAKSFEAAGTAMGKLGQSAAADACMVFAKRLRDTLPGPAVANA